MLEFIEIELNGYCDYCNNDAIPVVLLSSEDVIIGLCKNCLEKLIKKL